jgi:hypothetical protein
MLNPTFMQKLGCRENFCITFCIKPTHFSPNTVISPSQSDSNLLKTHVPQNAFLIRSQTLYPAELRARRNADAVLLDYDTAGGTSTAVSGNFYRRLTVASDRLPCRDSCDHIRRELARARYAARALSRV